MTVQLQIKARLLLSQALREGTPRAGIDDMNRKLAGAVLRKIRVNDTELGRLRADVARNGGFEGTVFAVWPPVRVELDETQADFLYGFITRTARWGPEDDEWLEAVLPQLKPELPKAVA